MKTIKAMRLTEDNFAEYGSAVYVDGEREPDAQSDIQTYFGQLAVMPCSGAMQVGICVAKNRAFVVDELEQHINTPELLAALKGEFIVPVTSSLNIDGRVLPDIENIKAVRVGQGQGVVFDSGMWHWTPYAVTDTCDVLVIFKKDTPKDDFITYKLENEVNIEV